MPDSRKKRDSKVRKDLTIELPTVAKELSPSTWQDFAALFEKHGGVWGGCWCMFHHVAKGWSKRTPQQNRRDKEILVREGKSHGILVYRNGMPVGWCQFGSEDELPRVDGLRGYGQIRWPSQWRITCFFVDRDHRGTGVAREALRLTLKAISDRGGGSVEGYPLDTRKKGTASSFLWSGTLGLFTELGFRRVRQLGKSRWLVRTTV